MAKFKVNSRRDKLGRKRWHWNLVADNGEIVATSETYNSEAAALNGARVVQSIAPGAEIREVDEPWQP